MSKWLRSNGDGTYTPEGIEANIGSTSDLPNPNKTVTENIDDVMTAFLDSVKKIPKTIVMGENFENITLQSYVQGDKCYVYGTFRSKIARTNFSALAFTIREVEPLSASGDIMECYLGSAKKLIPLSANLGSNSSIVYIIFDGTLPIDETVYIQSSFLIR